MSDLVGNPEDRFSHNEAHIMYVNGTPSNILAPSNDEKMQLIHQAGYETVHLEISIKYD